MAAYLWVRGPDADASLTVPLRNQGMLTGHVFIGVFIRSAWCWSARPMEL